MSDHPRVISRRDLLKKAGAAGAPAVATPRAMLWGSGAAAAAAAPTAAPNAPQARPQRQEALENLSAADADLLEAVLERLIPTDEHGPGAREARVIHYIDRALGGA